MSEPDEVGRESIPDGINSGLRLTGATSGIDRPESNCPPSAEQQDIRLANEVGTLHYTLTAETYRASNPGLLQEVPIGTNSQGALRENQQRTSWNLRQNDNGAGDLRDILAELELHLHRLLSSRQTDHQTSNTKLWTRCKRLIKENGRLRTLLKDLGADGSDKNKDKDLLHTAFYAWSTKAVLGASEEAEAIKAKTSSLSQDLGQRKSLESAERLRLSDTSFAVLAVDPTSSTQVKVREGSCAAIRDVEESGSSKKYELLPMWRDIAAGRYENRTSQLGNIGLRSSGSRLSGRLSTLQTARTTMKRGTMVEKLSLRSLSNKFRVNPVGWRRMTWEALGMAFILYDLVTVPLQAFNPPWNQFNIIMLCITSTYWTIDILSSFFIGFHIKGGLETRWRQMAKKYLLTWFVPDVLIVGIDWVLLVFELEENSENDNISYVKAGRGLRIMRFLRLLRLVKLSVYFDKILESSASEYVLTFMRVTKVILFILMSCHLIACAWYGIGDGLVSADVGWAHDTFKKHDSIGYRYTTSLHWSLTQFTPASMEVVPTNTVERCFNVCVVIVAMVMFSTFISSITEAMTYLRKINSKKSEQFNELRTYLAENQVTVELASRVWRYLEQSAKLRQKRLVYQDVTLLKDLPEVLRAELHQEMYSPVITRHCFFAQYIEYNHLGVRTICQRATVEVGLARGQYLFSLGENGKNMFFVADGIMEYAQDDDPDTQIVNHGGWVSEACLWLQWVHHGNMISKVESVLYVLDAGKVHSVLLLFTDMLPRVVEYAALFFKVCNKENPRYPVSDVWIDEDELLGIAQRAFEPEMCDGVDTGFSSAEEFNKVNSLSSAAEIIKGWWGSFFGDKKGAPTQKRSRLGGFFSEGSARSESSTL